jgi:hypothetical protein
MTFMGESVSRRARFGLPGQAQVQVMCQLLLMEQSNGRT